MLALLEDSVSDTDEMEDLNLMDPKKIRWRKVSCMVPSAGGSDEKDSDAL